EILVPARFENNEVAALAAGIQATLRPGQVVPKDDTNLAGVDTNVETAYPFLRGMTVGMVQLGIDQLVGRSQRRGELHVRSFFLGRLARVGRLDCRFV